MLNITFNKTKPSQKQYEYSIVGNAQVDVIRFVLQDDICSEYSLGALEDFDAFVKVESAGREYLDKISAVSTFDGSKNILTIDFSLAKKTTQFKNIALQLQFEDDEGAVVCQTEIVALRLKANIDADNELPDVYPDILHGIQQELDDHEERVSEIEEVIPSEADSGNKLVDSDRLASELNLKVDKVEGKGLSENDYTDSEKAKVQANTQARHTHSNKGVLDGISQAKVNEWDSKVSANNPRITIKKNGSSVGSFTLNQSGEGEINIPVPTKASDVNALPDTTKYGSSLVVSLNTSNYQISFTLKDQNGNALGQTQTIDLPMESVVVSGSYDSQTKEVVLTLQNGSTIKFSVADLVSGLVSTSDLATALENFYTKLQIDNKLAEKQNVIDSSHKLDSDLVNDNNQTHKFVSQSEKEKLAGIEVGAQVNVQPDWNETDSTKDSYIRNKPTLFYDLTISTLAPVGDSTILTGISIQVKDVNGVVIASGTFNGSPLVFPLPLNQTYKVECSTNSITIGGITYFAPEVESGSAEGTLVQDESVVFRYSSTQSINSLSAVKQFLALPDIDIATKRLALVRTETNSFSVDIKIKNPENDVEYIMPIYIVEIDNYTKKVNGVDVSFLGAKCQFAYALPDSIAFDEREQVECESGETFQDGIFYYTTTSSGVGDKTFTPLVAGTDYQNGDDIDTYKSQHSVYVFKHAWSNTQYGSGNSSTANLMRYGSNIYHESNIDKWLNGMGTDWFVASHLGDRLANWYVGKHGFKDWFTQNILSLIEDNVAYGVYERNNFELPNNKIYRMFVLPSGTEMAGSVNNNEGTVLEYWKYLNGGVVGNSANANRTVKKITNISSAQTTWFRSPYRSYSFIAWFVGYIGGISYNVACIGYAVLPTFTI